MAKNYALIEQLQGHKVPTPWIVEEREDEALGPSPVIEQEETVTPEPEQEEEKNLIESFWHWLNTDDD